MQSLIDEQNKLLIKQNITKLFNVNLELIFNQGYRGLMPWGVVPLD